MKIRISVSTRTPVSPAVNPHTPEELEGCPRPDSAGEVSGNRAVFPAAPEPNNIQSKTIFQ